MKKLLIIPVIALMIGCKSEEGPGVDPGMGKAGPDKSATGKVDNAASSLPPEAQAAIRGSAPQDNRKK